MLKVRVHSSSKFTGFAPGKKDGLDDEGNIVLRFGGDRGFTLGEIKEVIERFYCCPVCGGNLEVEISLAGPLPKGQLVGVIDGKLPVFHIPRTSSTPFYRWRCKSGNDICSDIDGNKWFEAIPPLKRLNWKERPRSLEKNEGNEVR
jgi:hypothetical protein